jgi:hypothetical protein
MISDALAQIAAMKGADEAKLSTLHARFTAAMSVIEAMREWAQHPTPVNIQALRSAEMRLDDALKDG